MACFSDGQGSKRRPVLVICDFGDADLLVAPVRSQAARVPTDVMLSDWRGAGLRLPSIVRLEKLATVEKSCVVRKLGALIPNDRAEVRKVLTTIFDSILK